MLAAFRGGGVVRRCVAGPYAAAWRRRAASRSTTKARRQRCRPTRPQARCRRWSPKRTTGTTPPPCDRARPPQPTSTSTITAHARRTRVPAAAHPGGCERVCAAVVCVCGGGILLSSSQCCLPAPADPGRGFRFAHPARFLIGSAPASAPLPLTPYAAVFVCWITSVCASAACTHCPLARKSGPRVLFTDAR